MKFLSRAYRPAYGTLKFVDIVVEKRNMAIGSERAVRELGVFVNHKPIPCDRPVGGLKMYNPEVYAEMRKESPESFKIAEGLYDGVLGRQMLVVRALVARSPKNRMFEIARIEAISHELPYTGTGEFADIVVHLTFRAEMNLKENELEMTGTSFEVQGPYWNDNPLRKMDAVNYLGTVVHNWSQIKPLIPDDQVISNSWLSPGSFAGCLVLSPDTPTNVRPYHPLLLPYIAMCLGSLNGSLQEKKDLATQTSSTVWSGQARENAIDCFVKRFGSFFAQAQRGNARDHLGSFFAS